LYYLPCKTGPYKAGVFFRQGNPVEKESRIRASVKISERNCLINNR
jgi:hypothetical protein